MARLWDSHALAGVPNVRAFLFLEVIVAVYTLCSWCKKRTPFDGAPWCLACMKAMDGVTPVQNSVTDAGLIASLREQVRTLTAERDEVVRDAVNVRANRDESNRQRRRLEDENAALRASVAELKQENERLARHHAERVDERNAAQQRAKELQRDLDAMLYAVGAKKEAP